MDYNELLEPEKLYKTQLKDKFHDNAEKYFAGLMRRINGLSSLLFYPPEFIGIMANLEAALLEADKDDFDFQIYRKLILDTHALVDKIRVE